MLQLGYEGTDLAHPRDLRFRIKLTGKDRSYVFDQRRRRSGWITADQGRVLYRPKQPLQDGDYRFEAELWDGLAWVAGERVFRLRIDSVPPADVEHLRLRVDQERERVVLEWDPVSLDRQGRPEYVVAYHVYRYERRGPFRSLKAHELGISQEPRFIDESWEPDVRVLFYKVTGEDEAGNEADRPE